VNYLHIIRNGDVPSELINLESKEKHRISEVRAWICVSPEARWVEVECLCGAISREGGPQDYLSLAQAAWGSLCRSTESVCA